MSVGLYCQTCRKPRDISGPKRIRTITQPQVYGPARVFKAEVVALRCGHKKILRRLAPGESR